MKIVQINATCGSGSTGKICLQISRLLSENRIENYIIYCTGESDEKNSVKCADKSYIKAQSLKARLFGNWGFNSQAATEKIINNLENIKPDIVHLHNIHGHDCNLDMLGAYLKTEKIKVIWTFHDCWAFTGYCMHFAMAKCDRWINGCYNCPLKHQYTWLFDRSREMYGKKKLFAEGLDYLIVTPSEWLADNVRRSFLKNHQIRVINNGIDLSVFKPAQSDFREKYKLHDKHIVLGVSFGWDEKKGLDVFIELSKRLDDKYRIVLVGGSDETDRLLPENIISIHCTQNQQELAQIYSVADVFVNPTREDSYPTVNMEAVACGTPVVTFRTGGSPEMLDNTCGSVVEQDDIDSLEAEIRRICETKPFSSEDCLKKAVQFDKSRMSEKYISLYKEIYDGITEDRA